MFRVNNKDTRTTIKASFYLVIFLRKFYNADELIINFLLSVKNRFVPKNYKVLIKCSFALVNFQPAPAENCVPITNTRYWSTNAYEAQYFKDYIHFSLKRYIKKRIIINAENYNS